MEIRPLREDDDRAAFHSGDGDLDRYFHRYAGQNQFRHHIGVTYVAVEGGRILGYATVAPGHLEIEGLPMALRSRLPRYPLPILRLARLATAEDERGKGVGKALLRFVFRLALKMSTDYGCGGVVVDAKVGAEGYYERLGFMKLEVVEGPLESRPHPVALFIHILDIEAADRR